MIAASLLEAITSLALQSLVLASLLATLGLHVVLFEDAHALLAEAYDARQAEQLLDTAVGAAGTGYGPPAPIAQASPTAVVLDADLDGDGAIDDRGAERTTLEIRDDSGDRSRLLHWLGRQAVTISADLPADARLELLGPSGAAAVSLAEITAVSVPIAATRVLSTVPARLP